MVEMQVSRAFFLHIGSVLQQGQSQVLVLLSFFMSRQRPAPRIVPSREVPKLKNPGPRFCVPPPHEKVRTILIFNQF